jgi:hypothetical protein
MITLPLLAGRFIQGKNVPLPLPCPRGFDGRPHPMLEGAPRAIGAPGADEHAAAIGLAIRCSGAMFHV